MKSIYLIPLFALCLLAPGFVWANDSDSSDIQLKYSVQAASLLDAMEIEIGLTLDDQNYAVDTNVRTSGFLSRVLPWSGQFFSKGHMNKGEFIPTEHRFSKFWSGDETKTTMNYNDGGQLTNMVVETTHDDPYYKFFNEDLTKDALDMLTAMVKSFVAIDEKQKCDFTQTVFDGKRRFHLVFYDTGEANLNNRRHSMYSGPTLTCEIEVLPIAGKWYDKKRGWMALQEQSRENGALPKVWLGKVDENAPLVPVRLQVRTNFGPLTMALTDYYRNGEDISDVPTASGE